MYSTIGGIHRFNLTKTQASLPGDNPPPYLSSCLFTKIKHHCMISFPSFLLSFHKTGPFNVFIYLYSNQVAANQAIENIAVDTVFPNREAPEYWNL